MNRKDVNNLIHSHKTARLTLLVSLVILLASLLSGCGGPDFGHFSDELRFGDEQVADTQVTDTMMIPRNGLGRLIGDDQIKWVMDQGYYIPTVGAGGATTPPTHLPYSRAEAIEKLKSTPSLQCHALSKTSQTRSPSQGEWQLKNSACVKERKLTWLEKTLWSEYEKQSKENFAWLSTSRNTLKATDKSVGILKANSQVNYGNWSNAVKPFLNILLAGCIIVSVISLICVAVRMLHNLRGEEDQVIMDKTAWIFLGAFTSSSAGAIVTSFFAPNHADGSLHEGSWSPVTGATYYVSDWVRAQLDPILIIVAVVGVMVTGATAAITTSGKPYIKLGKAFASGLACNILLAGGVMIFQDTVDVWTANMMKAASSMMHDAWNQNALPASQFFQLDGLLAVALVLLMWIMGEIMRIFTYLRAGMLPVLVGLSGVFGVMSYTEVGNNGFKKIMGWLATFLAYKPAAALFSSIGAVIMVTAGVDDDSQAITLFMQLSVIIILPLLAKWLVPAVSNMNLGGGAGVMGSLVAGGAGATVSGISGSIRGIGGMLRGRGPSRQASGPGGLSNKMKKTSELPEKSPSKPSKPGSSSSKPKSAGPDGSNTRKSDPSGTHHQHNSGPHGVPSFTGQSGLKADSHPDGHQNQHGSTSHSSDGSSSGHKAGPEGVNRSSNRRGKEF